MPKIKEKITCPYCGAQGIVMLATLQKSKALRADQVRYGCDNEHYFAVPVSLVAAPKP